MGKWDRFRTERKKVIDAYIAQRKIQSIAEGMTK